VQWNNTLLFAPDDPRSHLTGLHRLESLGDSWWQPWRLPPQTLAVTGSERLDDRARTASGARFSFVTDAEAISISLFGGEDSSAIDVIIDGSLRLRQPTHEGAQSVKFDLPVGTHQVEVWLPQFGPGLIGPVELENFRELSAAPQAALRWGAYGSSITQCRTADGPSETWPAIVSQALNWELSNLGFGGECQLDPIAATTLRDAEFDIISMCLGINIYIQSTFNARSLQPAICGFIDTVRAANPAHTGRRPCNCGASDGRAPGRGRRFAHPHRRSRDFWQCRRDTAHRRRSPVRRGLPTDGRSHCASSRQRRPVSGKGPVGLS
jgi:hypothetical protein